MRKPPKIFPTEKEIQKSIVQYLNSLPKTRVFEIRNGATWDPTRRVFRSNSSEKGIPDVLGSWRSIMVGFEIKRHNGKPTKEQVAVIEQLKQTGAIAGIVRSIDDVQKLLMSHLSKENVAANKTSDAKQSGTETSSPN